MVELSLEDIEFIKILATSDATILQAGMNDATRHRLDEQIGYFTLDVGLLWVLEKNNKSAYFGVSAYSINSPNSSFSNIKSRQKPSLSFQAGMTGLKRLNLTIDPII